MKEKGIDPKWHAVHENPPKNWRNIWNDRISLRRYDTLKEATYYVNRQKAEVASQLHIDIHPKDGYVVYKERRLHE